MIKAKGRHFTTLHMHEAHGAMASCMQAFNGNKEGGREIIVTRFTNFFVAGVNMFFVYKGNWDLVWLTTTCSSEVALLVVLHWVSVDLQFALVTLFEYVLHLSSCYLAPMACYILLLVSWRNNNVMRLKVRRKYHLGFCMEIENCYKGFFVLCTPVFVYYGILHSRMGTVVAQIA